MVGSEGSLRIPSWWMSKILKDIVTYCEEASAKEAIAKELSDVLFKNVDESGVQYIQENGLINSFSNALSSYDEWISELENRIRELTNRSIITITQTLPSVGESNKLYLIPSESTDSGNVMTEWIYVNGVWEKIGEFTRDISESPVVSNVSYDGSIQNSSKNLSEFRYVKSDGSTISVYPGAYADFAVSFGQSHSGGPYSVSQGYVTVAMGHYSHAEGYTSGAEGAASHAEGSYTQAVDTCSHAEGMRTFAKGTASHSEGYETTTSNAYEHAQGIYNVSNEGKTIHSVGIGTFTGERKNAHEITLDGAHYILGIGGYDGTKLDGATDIASYLTSLENRIKELEENLNK